MKFEEVADKYQASGRYAELSDGSRYVYEYAIRELKKSFTGRAIDGITRVDIIRLRTENEHRPGSANMIIRAMSIILSFALDMGYVPFNPASRVRKLKGGTYEKWTPEEVGRIVALRDRKVSTAVMLGWYTGQREGDILDMQWRHYDGEHIAVKQRKTNVEMKIKAHPDLKEYLDGIRGDARPEDYIVSGEKRMNGSAFRSLFANRRDNLGITKTFHGIRKGVASSLAESGSSINEIAAILGHKSLKMAAFYSEQANSNKMAESAVRQMVSCVS